VPLDDTVEGFGYEKGDYEYNSIMKSMEELI
jgi:hypothetical protein